MNDIAENVKYFHFRPGTNYLLEPSDPGTGKVCSYFIGNPT